MLPLRPQTYGLILFLVLAVAGGMTATFGFQFLSEHPLRSALGSIFAVSITPEDLHTRYATGHIKILVVPGHDPESFGAEYQGIREADLTLALAEHLVPRLKQDSRFDVSVTRDLETGNYTQDFDRYFQTQRELIDSFRNQLRTRFRNLVAGGLVEQNTTIHHTRATKDVALRLYGINKWANENDVDIVLHLHFNDYPGRRANRPGHYRGFSIYVPERQYPNAGASIGLARALKAKLETVLPVSNFRYESQGIVESQELVATGANASRTGVSLLIEYGYIYEPRFADAKLREETFQELASLTYQGLKEYFETSKLGQAKDGVLR